MVTRFTDEEYDFTQTRVEFGPTYLMVVSEGDFQAHLHLWVGPIGLHLYWPDFWCSRAEVRFIK